MPLRHEGKGRGVGSLKGEFGMTYLLMPAPSAGMTCLQGLAFFSTRAFVSTIYKRTFVIFTKKTFNSKIYRTFEPRIPSCVCKPLL